MNPRILLVTDERELRDWMRHHLDILWPEAIVTDMAITRFQDGLGGLDVMAFDLIVLCADCGNAEADPGEGLDVLRAAMAVQGCPPVVVIAKGGNELVAAEAIRCGAADYLPRSLISSQRVANALRLGLHAPRRGQRVERRRQRRPPRLEVDPDSLDLPQYSLLHKIGESSRAAVYLAYSATLGRNVALKISKPAVDAEEDCQEFAREYAAISALRHPSIVDIYDYGFHDGREFIAMEYFPCGDLKMRLQQPMTVPESLQYAHRICAALEVVHGAGLVHRDLKPPNVMLRENGSIVLIDFGLAKQLDKAHLNTMIGVLRGSPYYMSPEQAQGLALDGRSDLYSCGVILYEMLSGHRPFAGNTAVEVMQQHVINQRPPLPVECASLEPLLDRLMARERDQRFATASEACAALRGALDLLTVPSTRLADQPVTLQ